MKYATRSADDGEPIDSDTANNRAIRLAYRHLQNKNQTVLERLCAVHPGKDAANSTVIRDLVVEMLKVEADQCTVLVKSAEDYEKLRQVLRLSESSINQPLALAKGGLIPI